MNQSRLKSTLIIVEQIQALRQQKKSNKVIKIEISKEIRKNNFNKQQIEEVFINTQTVLKKETAKSDRQEMKPFQKLQILDMTNLLMLMPQNQQQQIN